MSRLPDLGRSLMLACCGLSIAALVTACGEAADDPADRAAEPEPIAVEDLDWTEELARAGFPGTADDVLALLTVDISVRAPWKPARETNEDGVELPFAHGELLIEYSLTEPGKPLWMERRHRLEEWFEERPRELSENVAVALAAAPTAARMEILAHLRTEPTSQPTRWEVGGRDATELLGTFQDPEQWGLADEDLPARLRPPYRALGDDGRWRDAPPSPDLAAAVLERLAALASEHPDRVQLSAGELEWLRRTATPLPPSAAGGGD